MNCCSAVARIFIIVLLTAAQAYMVLLTGIYIVNDSIITISASESGFKICYLFIYSLRAHISSSLPVLPIPALVPRCEL